MPDTKSELNDIILNKSHSTFGGFKKVLLAVASFAVLLIIVVVVMSSLNEKPSNSLANTILPPEPTQTLDQGSELFKPVEIVQESSDDEQARLEAIANEIKQQTLLPAEASQSVQVQDDQDVVVTDDDVVTIDDPYETVTQVKAEPRKPVVKKPIVKKPVKTTKTVKTTRAIKGKWYVQVGSFERVKPNEELISKIKRLGYSYKAYKSKVNGQRLTKLLIGPYPSYKKAQAAKPRISREIEAAAFIYQVVK